MKREYFVFTIGYKGNFAIIDSDYLKNYGKLSTKQLFEKGLLKQSYASAFFEGDLQTFVLLYNEKTDIKADEETIKKWFGLDSVPNISRFLFI